jgi:hypothetical protein
MGAYSNCNMHINNQIYNFFNTTTKIKANFVPNPNHDIKNKNMTCAKQKSNKIVL